MHESPHVVPPFLHAQRFELQSVLQPHVYASAGRLVDDSDSSAVESAMENWLLSLTESDLLFFSEPSCCDFETANVLRLS